MSTLPLDILFPTTSAPPGPESALRRRADEPSFRPALDQALGAEPASRPAAPDLPVPVDAPADSPPIAEEAPWSDGGQSEAPPEESGETDRIDDPHRDAADDAAESVELDQVEISAAATLHSQAAAKEIVANRSASPDVAGRLHDDRNAASPDAASGQLPTDDGDEPAAAPRSASAALPADESAPESASRPAPTGEKQAAPPLGNPNDPADERDASQSRKSQARASKPNERAAKGREASSAAPAAASEPSPAQAAANVLSRQPSTASAESTPAAIAPPSDVTVDPPADAGQVKPVTDAGAGSRLAHATLDRLSAARTTPPPPHDQSAAGPHIDPARFVSRVEGAMRTAHERDGRVQVRLSPPELGSLKIELQIQNGVLAAKIEAETSAARNLLLDNLPALRERLAQQDIRVERFDVEYRPGDGERHNGQPDHHRPDQAPERPRQAAAKPASAPRQHAPHAPHAPHGAQRAATDRTLDIRI